jgi:hypothetical protein
MARQYYSSALASTTHATASLTSKLALTFTPDANSDYLIIWSCQVSPGTNTIDWRAQLFDSTAAAARGENRQEANSTSEFESAGGIFRYQEGASPVSRTFQLRFSNESGTTTLTIRNLSLVAIKMGASDAYAADDTSTTAATTTYVTKPTLNITPATDGDYLILASCETGSGNLADAARIRMQYDGVTRAECLYNRQQETANQKIMYAHLAKVTLDATAHAITLQHANDATATTTTVNARIAALRLDDGFLQNAYAEATARTTSAVTSDQTKLQLTNSLNRQEFIILCASNIDTDASTASNIEAAVTDGGNDLFRSAFRAANTGTVESPFFGIAAWTPPASGAQDLRFVYRTVTSGTAAASDSALIILSLGSNIVCDQPAVIDETDTLGAPISALQLLVEASAAGVATTDYTGTPECISYAEASVIIGFQPSAGEIASAVWGALRAAHNQPGSFGEHVQATPTNPLLDDDTRIDQLINCAESDNVFTVTGPGTGVVSKRLRGTATILIPDKIVTGTKQDENSAIVEP